MLAVDAHRHTGQHGWHLAFQRGEVARVNDGRAQFAEQAQQLRVQPRAVAGRLVQRDELDVVTLDASAEFGRHLGQRDDRMPVGRGRHVVDQVDDTVLEAAGVEAIE